MPGLTVWKAADNPEAGRGWLAKEVRGRLGARLKEWRRVRRLTQEQLAERAGLSYKFIGEIERGRGNPTIDTLFKLSQALELDVADLFGVAGAWKPADVFGLSAREAQMVREAARSLGDVADRLESPPYRRRRARSRS